MFTFRHDYVEDLELRDGFKRFLREIHGLDLGLWERCGYWDRRYMPFSFFDGGEVVSSVCLYSLDMVVAGTRCKIAQISGVGTRQDLRRRGLNRELTERAMRWAHENGHEAFFLFSDPDAVPFYRRMGFRPVLEWVPSLRLDPVPRRGGAIPLDMNRSKDRRLVERLGQERSPVSNALGVLSPKLLMFHALYTIRDHLYHIVDLNLIAAIRSEDEGLLILDLIGPELPSLAEILPYFASPDVRRVSFGFVPDRLGLDAWDAREDGSQNLHLGGESRFGEDRILFPYTARA